MSWRQLEIRSAALLGVAVLLLACGGTEKHSEALGIVGAPIDASLGATSDTAGGPTTDNGGAGGDGAGGVLEGNTREASISTGADSSADDAADGAAIGNGDGSDARTEAGPSLCAAGNTRCSGKTVVTCDAGGFWQTERTCACSCVGVACVATCVPGSRQCIETTPYWCDPATCTWGPRGPACSYACARGECTEGVCVPGSKQCDGVIPQTCNVLGTWSDGPPCSSVCLDGGCAN